MKYPLYLLSCIAACGAVDVDEQTSALSNNLVANPSFEASTTGWSAWQASVGRTGPTSAPDGSYAALVTRLTGTSYSIDDSPDTVSSIPLGIQSYVASVYVQAASASAVGKSITLAVRERAGSQQIHLWTSTAATLSSTAAQLTVTTTAPAAGNTLDLYVLQTGAVAGDAFYADAFSLRSAPDVTAPTVSITSPATGHFYASAQTVTIQTSAADNLGVTKVEFYDGGVLKATDTGTPFSYAWNVATAATGEHAWTAKAYDAAGNATTSAVVTLKVNLSRMPLGVPGAWTLAFSDEFNGTSVDTTTWDPHWYSEGGIQNNVGTYAANAAVAGGYLILTLASSTSGASVNTQSNNGFSVGVGMYAEAKVYFPGNGTQLYNWPSWWISGPSWPAAGENDIAEVLGGLLTVNYHSPSGGYNQGAVPGYWGGAFHTFGVHRKASSADVYWDGTLVKSYATDDNGGGQYLIFNLGRTAASANPAYGSASQLKVDYVRVWQ